MTATSATVTMGVDADFYRPRGPKTLAYKGTRANQPTLIKFGAAWCGACVAYTESGGWRDTIALAKRLGVELRDCDADRHQQALALVAEYSGSDDVGIPLLILFHAPGDDAAPVVYDGAMEISAIREWLERHLRARSASAATGAAAATTATTITLPSIAPSTSLSSSASSSSAAAASSRRRRLDATGARKTSERERGNDDGGDDTDASDRADRNGGDDELRANKDDVHGEGDSTSSGVTKLAGQREVRDYLKAHRGGVVVLQWSVPGCEWCAELAEEMGIWRAHYGGASGIAFAETDASEYGLSRLKWSRFPVTQVLCGGVERAVVRGYQPATIEDEIDRIAREDTPTARR